MTSKKETFLRSEEHFDRLVERLKPSDKTLYTSQRHVRVEELFRGRSFVVYDMRPDNTPRILDKLSVLDFQCDHKDGASTLLRNQVGAEIEVGYNPVRLFGYSVMVFLPLHVRIRWSVAASNIDKGSLAFGMCLRTMSRLSLREPSVQYCETSVTFEQEFGAVAKLI